MPNHFHLILYFPENNCLSACMRDLKKYTSFKIRQDVEKTDAQLFRKLHFYYRQQLFKVWEDRFYDVWLGGREILEAKLDYIHNNPLQSHWNLCELPEQYAFSSAAFYNNEMDAMCRLRTIGIFSKEMAGHCIGDVGWKHPTCRRRPGGIPVPGGVPAGVSGVPTRHYLDRSDQLQLLLKLL